MPIFDASLSFDPAGGLDAFLRQVPARWVVYLFADERDQPIQLLCVRNLRASLKRRLGGDETIGVSKRVNYRQIVRRITWRRVDSAFEADWVYLEAARELFPEQHKAMVGFRPAWFVHVNPDARFPRYTRTNDLSINTGVLLGPVEDKHAAQRLVQLTEDSFDLCRYYNILIEAPHGRACPYKEMGKCPAPCDGSIPMEQYRAMVRSSAAAIADPTDALRQETQRMAQASAGLQFEQAARSKARLQQLAQFGQGPFRHARPLRQFAYLSLQRGPRAATAKVFLITPGRIEPIAAILDQPAHPGDLLRAALQIAEERRNEAIDEAGTQRISLVAHHLFMPKQSQGVFLRMDQVDEKALIKAWRELVRQKSAEEDGGEGIVKEMQAI